MLTDAVEHTLLVTETGVEVLTARLPNSPGGAISEPVVPLAVPAANTPGAIGSISTDSTTDGVAAVSPAGAIAAIETKPATDSILTDPGTAGAAAGEAESRP